MKKAQILSAIALAFALGVTPVIATVNTVSAFTVEDIKANVDGAASKAEVEAAVAAVKGKYPVYNNMIALNKVTTEIAKDAGKYDIAVTWNTSTGAKIPNVAGNINLKLQDFISTDLTSDDIKDTWYEVDSNIEIIDNAIALAKTVNKYDNFAALFSAIENKDEAAFRIAIRDQINPLLKVGNRFDYDKNVTISGFTNNTGTVKLSAVKAALADNTKTVGGAEYDYDDYSDLFGYIDEAETAEANYEKYYSAIYDALTASGVMSAKGNRALAEYLSGDGAENPKIADLYSLAVTSKDDTLNNFDEWMNVKTYVEAAEKGASAGATDYNYDLVLNIAIALKEAVPVLGQTPEEIAANLVGYVATEEAATTTVYSADGIVSVTGKGLEGVVVSVEKVERKVDAFGDRKTAMYDIVLTKDGAKFDLKGQKVLVTLKFDGVDGSKAGVYYVDGDNKASYMDGSKIEGEIATFYTTHFSIYAVVEDAAGGLPNTGVISAIAETSASTTVAMVAGIATALTAAGAGVVAYRNARRSVRK